jgi:hypothetical protein
MKKIIAFGVMLFCLAGLSLAVRAAESTETLENWIIGAGGSAQGNSTYALDYTLGQPVTGESENQGYHLCAGYWCDPMWRTYVPIVLR